MISLYKVKDIVVYRRDVCRITGKKRSDFTGEQCYILEPYFPTSGSVSIQVPVSNKAGHLRDLITKEEIDQLIIDTPDLETLESKPANMKSQYASLLKGNDISELVRIIKTSYGRNQERLEQHKKLASIDDEYLQIAEKYLYEELSVVLDLSIEDTKEYFEKEVAKLALE